VWPPFTSFDGGCRLPDPGNLRQPVKIEVNRYQMQVNGGLLDGVGCVEGVKCGDHLGCLFRRIQATAIMHDRQTGIGCSLAVMLFLLVTWVLVPSGHTQDLSSGRPTLAPFSNPQRIAILGYEDDAMEPFISRDGKYLFFNNSNGPQVNTNLQWAERVEDATFRYRGEIAGVNTAALDGVPSMDRDVIFHFVSTRIYHQTASTVYRSKFSRGMGFDIELVPEVSVAKSGIVNFDAEISADGNTPYFVESHFSLGKPKDARILIAMRTGKAFVRSDDSETMLATVNAGGFSYAPATATSELEIFFTRLDPNGPAIYTATRPSPAEPFHAAHKIEAIPGFVEGPTLSADGGPFTITRKKMVVLPSTAQLGPVVAQFDQRERLFYPRDESHTVRLTRSAAGSSLVVGKSADLAGRMP
jgi:hypothetical protein